MIIEGQEVGMATVMNAIKLDVLMAINACAQNNNDVALQHLVTAQQTIDKLLPIVERTDEVMASLSTVIKKG